MPKLPWFPFFPGDWRRHPNLRRCGYAARGMWIDMLCLAFDCDESGVLAAAGRPWTDEEIVCAVGGDTQLGLSCIRELLDKGVATRNTSGAIFSSRMYRDGQIRKARSDAGRSGGRPRKAKQKQTESKPQTSPSDSDSDPDSGFKQTCAEMSEKIRADEIRASEIVCAATETAREGERLAWTGSVRAERSRRAARMSQEKAADANPDLPSGVHEAHWIDGLSQPVMDAVLSLAISYTRMGPRDWDDVRRSVQMKAGEAGFLEAAAVILSATPPGTLSDACTLANSTKAARVISSAEPIKNRVTKEVRDAGTDAARVRSTQYDNVAKTRRG